MIQVQADYFGAAQPGAEQEMDDGAVAQWAGVGEALGGLILATHRGLEALAKAGVDAKTRNRIAGAAIGSIALPAS